jgi:hypothetical protein
MMDKDSMVQLVRGQVSRLREWLENPPPADEMFVVGQGNMWVSEFGYLSNSGMYNVTTDVTKAIRFPSKGAMHVAMSVHGDYRVRKAKVSIRDVKKCLKAAEAFLKLAG